MTADPPGTPATPPGHVTEIRAGGMTWYRHARQLAGIDSWSANGYHFFALAEIREHYTDVTWDETPPGTPATSDELLERVAAAMCDADAHGVPWERLSALPGHGIRAARYRRFAREAVALIVAAFDDSRTVQPSSKDTANTLADLAATSWEWGVEYEKVTDAHPNEASARLHAGISRRPVVRRTIREAGPWTPVDKEAETDA